MHTVQNYKLSKNMQI